MGLRSDLVCLHAFGRATDGKARRAILAFVAFAVMVVAPISSIFVSACFTMRDPYVLVVVSTLFLGLADQPLTIRINIPVFHNRHW